MHIEIGCPEQRVFNDLLNGALTNEQEMQLIEHLTTCRLCQHTLESLTAGTVDDVKRQLQQGREAWSLSEGLQQTIQRLKDQTPNPETSEENDWSEEILLRSLAPSQIQGHLGRLGSYEIVEIIGRGGFGVVFKAFDPSLNRFVALKVLAPHLASNAAARKRFAREAKAAAAVRDEHVVAIHSVDEANGLPYLVMEYISGISLQQRLDRNGPLALEEILRIGRQTASGLAAAHSQGLIHRDIKPANILLENNVERVKITDFGLARAADDAGQTQSGMLAGTPQYMAPEQARGESLDHRADLFSLGSVLYALCTGRPPFRASSTLGVLRRISEETPLPIRQINPAIPDWLAEVIFILQAKEPAERFSSAAEVADLLGRYLAHLQQPKTAPKPSLPQRARSSRRGRSRRWLVAALCLAGTIGLFAQPTKENQINPDGTNRFYQDFRGRPIDKRFFMFTGPKAPRQITEEADGLRITLPAEGEEPQPTGLATNFRVIGDFEITTSYELLKADKPADGWGLGVQLYIMMESATREAVLLGRFHDPRQGHVYMSGRMTTDAEGKRRYRNENHAADARSGRLRLTRRGSLVTCLVAENNSDDFQSIQEFELGTADIVLVRVAADTGHSQSPVEVRIGDFEIRALGVPAEVSPQPPRWRRLLLYLTLAIGAACICAGGLRVWRCRRQQEKPAKTATKPPGPATPPRSKSVK
jgi:serine/threonine protein kinase